MRAHLLWSHSNCSQNSSTEHLLQYTLFQKQYFYKQRQAKISKNSSKSSATPWGWTFAYLKIISFFHPRYHPKVIGDILKNVQKYKCICFNDVIWLMTMKRPPTPVSIYVQHSSTPLTLDGQFQTNPHTALSNDNQ